MKAHTIDAKGKRLGTLAAEVASILNGKTSPEYASNKVVTPNIIVKNVAEMDIDQKKLKEKLYKSYSGYPGGLKIKSMEEVIDRRGMNWVLRSAVYGMLPKNKLRDQRIKKLNIE